MFVEDLLNGWKLYGKTGNGSQLNANGTKIKDRQVGWFVGFACKGMQTMTFAYLIVDDDKQETVASLRAKSALKTELTKILITAEKKTQLTGGLLRLYQNFRRVKGLGFYSSRKLVRYV